MGADETGVPNLEYADGLLSNLVPRKRECKIMGECAYVLSPQIPSLREGF